VIDISDENVSGFFLFLEMAFQAKRCVAFVQQSLVDGAMRRMADHTALAQRLVLVNKWAPLRGVALETSFVSAQESKATALERLLNIGAAAFDRDSLVRVVTIGATHFPFQHRMMVRQLELCPHFQVTLETGLRIFPRVDDRVRRATALDVQTARPVARLTAHVRNLLWSSAALCLSAFSAALTHDYLFCLQSRVSRCSEITHNFFVASPAFL
jgi:hypothetical protein